MVMLVVAVGGSCWHCCSKRLCKLLLSGLRERRRNVGQELKRSVVWAVTLQVYLLQEIFFSANGLAIKYRDIYLCVCLYSNEDRTSKEIKICQVSNPYTYIAFEYLSDAHTHTECTHVQTHAYARTHTHFLFLFSLPPQSLTHHNHNHTHTDSSTPIYIYTHKSTHACAHTNITTPTYQRTRTHAHTGMPSPPVRRVININNTSVTPTPSDVRPQSLQSFKHAASCLRRQVCSGRYPKWNSAGPDLLHSASPPSRHAFSFFFSFLFKILFSFFFLVHLRGEWGEGCILWDTLGVLSIYPLGKNSIIWKRKI